MKFFRKAAVFLLILATSITSSQLPLLASEPKLELSRQTNAFNLTVSGLSTTGAIFIVHASNLQTLAESPSLLFQTNNISTNNISLQVSPSGSSGGQGFFSATHWPGLSTEDFGDPEDYPDEPPPDTVLVTAGMPEPLVSGQQFTVDFFVIDPAGQLLSLTQAVSIRVLRESDGAIHPDAQVSPSAGQLVGGHLRATITITATASLDGYTLGLGPGGVMLLSLTTFLKTSFNISTNISITTSNELYQALENLRTNSIDANPAWAYPLSGADDPVSGTFGEWRGRGNTNVHKGLDLAAPASSRVLAARGGVVSRRNPLPGVQGHYLVIDHGDGWFSRYLHLQANQIAVKVGSAVTRGQTLATNLFSGWTRIHLHFEIRQGANQSQWDVPFPGSGQDPLQTPGIFSVAAGTRAPELEEVGLTRQHPAQNAFVKSPPNGDASGPVYFFAKFLDKEPKTGGYHRLSLRALGFKPEGVVTNNWIWPSNDARINELKPPLTAIPSGTLQKGFARYDGTHAANEAPLNYFRYWWKWDTSTYTNATGPRSFVLTGVDYATNTTNHTFTFGPQIMDVSVTKVGADYWFTNIAYLGTNPSPQFVQPDQYKVQILQANGQSLSNVTWNPALLAGGYTPVINTHTNKQTFSFALPSEQDTSELRLRVSSRLAPDIACEALLRAVFVFRSENDLSGFGSLVSLCRVSPSTWLRITSISNTPSGMFGNSSPVSAVGKNDGMLYLAYRESTVGSMEETDMVVQVDPTTGSKTTVSSVTVSDNPIGMSQSLPPAAVSVTQNGNIYVLQPELTDGITRRLKFRRALSNQWLLVATLATPQDSFAANAIMAPDANGMLLVAYRSTIDFDTNDKVVRINPTNGLETLISTLPASISSPFHSPIGLCDVSSGDIYVIQREFDGVLTSLAIRQINSPGWPVRVRLPNPVTSPDQRVALSSDSSGMLWVAYRASAPAGSEQYDRVVRVNPTTGTMFQISSVLAAPQSNGPPFGIFVP